MSQQKFTTDQKVWIGASLAAIGGIVYACLKPREGYLQRWQRQQLNEKFLELEPEDLLEPATTEQAISQKAGGDGATEGEPFQKLVDAVKDALGLDEGDDDDAEAA
jgi:hypothetical protein